jgi:hypothetical protein
MVALYGQRLLPDIEVCMAKDPGRRKTGMNFNTLGLGIFSTLILVIGTMVFFMPENLTLLSTTYPYNLFRVDLGLIGIIIALFNNKKISKYSNLALGTLIAYQAIASFSHFYPEEIFQWTILDDILNADIGLAMILLSFFEKDELIH